MRYAAFCLWVIVPLGLWLGVTYWGTPHIVFSYRFYDNGDRHNPFADRTYFECTYIGWLGAVTVPAEDGRCPMVRVFQREGG